MSTKIRKLLKGQALFEYVMLLIFVISAFLIFQKYIVRAMSGRWKSVGDTIGHGLLYDPTETLECATFGYVTEDARFATGDPGVWYNVQCFEANCVDFCYHAPFDVAACNNCIANTCREPDCN